MFKKVYLNNVPSGQKTRSYGTPPNKGTQKAVLTNLSKNFLLEARKMFKKLFLDNISSDNWKGVLTNLVKTSCSNSECLLRKIKTFFGSVLLDTFNAFLKTIGQPFTQSSKKNIQRREPLPENESVKITPTYLQNGSLATLGKIFVQCLRDMPAHSKDFFNNLLRWTSTMEVARSAGNFISTNAFLRRKLLKNVVSNI